MKNNIKSIYPLSPMQEGMMFHKMLNENSSEYFIRFIIRFTGILDPQTVRESLDILGSYYDILRTAFLLPKKGTDPLQVVLEDRKIEFSIIDIKECTEKECELEKIKQADLNRGFDLQKDSLLRVTVVLLSQTESIALWSLHHIILDGWCCTEVLNNFLDIYKMFSEGESKQLIHSRIQSDRFGISSYEEYIKWLKKQDKKQALSYWRELLSDYSDSAQILYSRQIKASQDEMCRYSLNTSVEFTNALNRLARNNNVTVNTVLETCLGILLQKYNRTNDVVFGKVVSGRNCNLPGIDRAVGLFINTIPVRIEADENITCEKLLHSVHEQAILSTEFSFCSLAEIQNESSLGNELIKILFVYENTASGKSYEEKKDLGNGLNAELLEAREQTNYSLNFSVSLGNSFDMDLIYDPRLYKEKDIISLLNRYRFIIQSMIDCPDGKVKDIPDADEWEEKEILEQFNDTYTKYPENETVTSLLEKQAQLSPNRIAITWLDQSITYGRLNELSNQVAIKLRNLGVRNSDYIAIIAERNIQTIIGFCGIIKAGGIYVPINPDYPVDRIKYILEDCEPKVFIGGKEEYGSRIFNFDISQVLTWKGCIAKPEIHIKSQDMIYLIYTSGTTGQPKGVMIEHKNVIRLVYNTNYIDLNDETVILQTGSLSFDAATFEIWGTLLKGGRLCIAGNNTILDAKLLKTTLEEYDVNTMFLTTALFNQLISQDKTVFDKLRTLLFGGEQASENHVKKLLKANSHIRLANIYGPTETTTFTTWFPIHAEKELDKLPIGKPISNTKTYVMNEGRLCGIGIPGELCIAGDGVGRGYLKRPELTAEKFIKNPYAQGMMYRSGDLVRWLEDGNLEFLGRIDDQIKLRGYRIELGEIAEIIRQQEQVEDAVVIVSERAGEKEICAYVVMKSNMELSDLNNAVKKKLPPFMVPAHMMKLEKIPVTSNGKLDRKALPPIGEDSSRDYTPPRNGTENNIAAIFEKVLCINHVSIDDNFFDLGGHSLKAAIVINQIESVTGVRIPLKELFREPTVRGLARIVRDMDKSYSPIPRAEQRDAYPMSAAQKRIFIISELDDIGIAYNVYSGVEICGNLDVEKVRKIYYQLIDRYEIFRTSFFVKDGVPLQKVLPKVEADIEYEESDSLTDEEKRMVFSEFVRPFDLAQPPLFRLQVRKVRNGNDILLFDFHHIVCDGVSIELIKSDFTKLYAGEKLTELKIQYKDFSEWLGKREISRQKDFWISQFKGDIPVLDLPLDYKRKQNQDFNGDYIKVILDNHYAKEIKNLCRSTGTTEYMIFLSAIMVLLSKYSRQEDIVIGSPVSGRIHKDTESIVGLFVNTLALRGRPSKEKIFEDFLKEIKKICLDAQDNQEYAFDELVEAVTVQREISRNPLFDVVFSYQNEEEELKADGLIFKDLDINRKISKFDLTITITQLKSGYEIGFEYCTGLFRRDTICSMLDHFTVLLSSIVEDHSKKLSELKVVSSAEYNKIKKFQNPEVILPSEKTVIDLFIEQVESYPHKVAIAYKDHKLTYEELNNKSDWIAVQLRKAGVCKGDYVAVIAERRVETIIGFVGIIKAGAAYVPIDTSYPTDRISYIINDCRPKAILTYENNSYPEIPNINLLHEIPNEKTGHAFQSRLRPDDILYLIYTSGTTGKPKGAMIEHKGVVRLVHHTEYVPLSEETVILQTGSMAFDAATFEIWGALLNGGELHVEDQEVILDPSVLKKTIIDRKINTMWLTVSLFNQLADMNITLFDSLKILLIGGEKVSEAHVRKLLAHNHHIQLYNGYGPTETTTFATCYPIRREDTSSIPIGRPITNTWIYILDGLQPCGILMAGELCIAGDGVARGYLNNPELTAEKFTYNPFTNGGLYRTGDLARWRPDGNIEFMGRLDGQIKLRGFRIELNEIEDVLKGLEEIQDAAVILNGEGEDKKLCAFLKSDSQLNIKVIREQIRKDLPDYMLPSYFVQIAEIPLNMNGKLNRAALPNVEIKADREYVSPENGMEKEVISVFENVLGLDKIGLKDNFFEIGGDSIKAIRAVSKLRELGYSISMREILNTISIKEIIESLKIIKKEFEYAQTPVYGEAQLTPVQDLFFKWNLPEPGHFNQSIMLRATEGFDESAVKAVLEKIIEHHDMLRCVFRNNSFYIMDIEKGPFFELRTIDMRGLSNEEVRCSVAEENTKLHREMDLENGPLLRCKLYKTNDGDHLIIIIHHLLVDGVSWRILFEDFTIGYDQYIKKQKITFPKKTASFLAWSHGLKAYGNNLKTKKEAEYWNQVGAELKAGIIPKSNTGEQKGYKILSFELSSEKTSHLLYRAKKTFGAEINELLLAALAWANQSWQGGGKIAVFLESHGRGEILKDIQVDRTVGWFTSIYPIILKTGKTLEQSVINAEETIRKVPGNGIGYGILKQMGVLSFDDSCVDCSCNYLGNMEEFNGRSRFERSSLSQGVQIGEENVFSSIIWNSMIREGRFCQELWFDKSQYDINAMSELLQLYKSTLLDIVDKNSQTALNSSVFPKIKVSTQNLFALKQYDVSDVKETGLYQKMINYETNRMGQREVELRPFAYQKFFLTKYPDSICSAFSDIKGSIAIEYLLELVRSIIEEQSIFRLAYQKEQEKLIQYQYFNNWYIPYFDDTVGEENLGDSEIYESLLSMPDLFNNDNLLSKVFIVRLAEEHYRVYFFIHHAIWDLTSTDILKEIIDNKIDKNTSNTQQKDLYTLYTSERAQKELLTGQTEGMASLVKKFYDDTENHYKLLNGKAPQFQAHITVKYTARLLEKILDDPVLWAVKLYSLLNFDECSIEENDIIPFLLMNFGRQGQASGNKTMGLYLDIIPYVYNRCTQSADVLSNAVEQGKWGHLILESVLKHSDRAEKLFNITPAVNFYADLETNNVFGPCDDYQIEIKPIPGGDEITMRIFKDSLYIAVPVAGPDWNHIKETAGNFMVSNE